MKSGTITRLVLQKKNVERVSVFLDDEFAFGLYKDTILSHNLRKGVVLSVEAQTALLHADSFFIAKNSAMHSLGRRMHTIQELRRKLIKKEFPETVVAEVLAYLEERDYINDRVFAKMFAESRFASKQHGAQRIRMDLLKKGVAKPIIDKALQQVFSKIDVAETIEVIAEKQWQKLQREPDVRKRQQKLYAFLLRRGFKSDEVLPIIRKMQ